MFRVVMFLIANWMKCYNITKINWFEIMFMLFYKNILTLSILAAVSATAFAAENEKDD